MTKIERTLAEVTILAHELLGNDAETWLVTRNEVFNGVAPFDVIDRGDGQEVLDFLLERTGRKAGYAF